MKDKQDPITVVLADDQTLVRAGFRMVLDRSDDIQVVGEASNGREALALVRESDPDVVLMDIQMPGVDGIEATRTILSDDFDSAAKVIVLTTFDHDDYVVQALRAGASGFLLKDTEPEELRAAVRVVMDGHALLAPSITRRVISEFVEKNAEPRTDPKVLDVLTDREREVVSLVAEGLNNQEIGDRLYISPATAKTHVGRALMKLHARDRAQLVVIAFETGLAPQ